VPLRDDQDQVIGWFGSATDIEDLKQAEAARRESEERFRLLVEGARDYAMFLLDPENRITFWSVGAARVFGWSEAEALGQSGALIFTPEDRTNGEMERELHSALTEGSAVDRRWHVRQDGTRLFLDGVLMRLDEEAGTLRGFVKIGRDATVQHQAEEALRQLNATLEERIAERTAALLESEQQLRRVASLLTMAEQEERRRISQILHDDLQQQLYSIQMKLSFARQEATAGDITGLLASIAEADQWLTQGVEITRELTVDLSPPILHHEGLVAMLRWLSAQMKELHGLAVTVVAGHEVPLPNQDMRVLLFQIVRELLFNVVKHAGTDRATVELRSSESDLVIRVMDAGQGFDVGEVLARAESASGFGLFSVRERLALFGASMAVVSAPGAGTQVTLTIPLALA
jgi:PAS domain S-box-containing protein